MTKTTTTGQDRSNCRLAQQSNAGQNIATDGGDDNYNSDNRRNDSANYYGSHLPSYYDTTMMDVGDDNIGMNCSNENASLSTPVVLRRTVRCRGNSTNKNPGSLRLIVLGCESKPPYGPNDHTAALLMDLICQAMGRTGNSDDCNTATEASAQSASDSSADPCCDVVVTLQVFAVQDGKFPTDDEWDACDGVLLPGSFSSAYWKDLWIDALKSVIQERVVRKRIPTLAICFGHQVFAHSFPDGECTKILKGAPRCGRRTMTMTQEGSMLLNNGGDCGEAAKTTIDLYYTHNDMVRKLPSTAVCLGGSSDVLCEAAAYFATVAEVEQMRLGAAASQYNAVAVNGIASSGRRCGMTSSSLPRPYAITLQAHPEYATSLDLGMYRTLELVMDASERAGNISREERLKFGQDAHYHYPSVQNYSVELMAKIGQLLGWFN